MQHEQPGTVPPLSNTFTDHNSTSVPMGALLKDGLVAGLVGALTIALWFLVVDALAGRPFYTPTLLGTAFFHHGKEVVSPATLKPSLDIVFQYSVFHWIAFTVMGVVASLGLRFAASEPHLGFGMLLFFVLFVVFEFGFRLMRAVLFSPQVEIAWLPVLIGNLLASAAIGIALLYRHRQVHTP